MLCAGCFFVDKVGCSLSVLYTRAGIFLISCVEYITPKRKIQARLFLSFTISLHENGFGGCLADDMGLGKTFQVIAYLSDRRFCNTHNLIIMQKTLLLNWLREISKFNNNLKTIIYHGKRRDINGLKDFEIILTTYGVVVNDILKFQQMEFCNIVLDEAQQIKNEKSKAYLAVTKLRAQTKISLTGTPIENNLKEYLNP